MVDADARTLAHADARALAHVRAHAHSHSQAHAGVDFDTEVLMVVWQLNSTLAAMEEAVVAAHIVKTNLIKRTNIT